VLNIRSRAALQLRQQQLFRFWYEMSCQYISTWVQRWVISSSTVRSVHARKKRVVGGEIKMAEKAD